MSSDDDTRILNMRINNKDFLRGTADSLKAIDTLNKGIDGAGKGKGMSDMAKSVDTVKSRFSALQVVGVTALATLTNKAVNAGLNFAKSFTIAPIIDGFREYEKLLTSTQTISANTGLIGEKGLGKVNDALDDLNVYADQTIYNFGQMADSIGKFTAAGGKGSLRPSVDAIKGMANSAALAGADVNQLNTAMYQMSQAMSTGVIKLMDWKSLENASMGTKGMQQSLKMTARTFDDLGPKMENAIKSNGSFRESLSEGWLTADVFSKTMKVMGGTMVDATTDATKLRKMGFDKNAIAMIRQGKSVAYSVKQLEKMGYSTEAAKKLNELSQSAIKSATEIKTFTQLIDVAKESVGSGWAMIFRSLFGDLREAGKLWTTVGDAVTGTIDKIFGAIAGVLAQWRKLGGYQKLWAGFGNIFKALGNLLAPFGALLRAIAPGTEGAGKGMYNMTNAFYNASVGLEKFTGLATKLNPIFAGIGTAIRWVYKLWIMWISGTWNIIKAFFPLASALFELGKALAMLPLKLLELIGVGDAFVGTFDGVNSIVDVFKKLGDLRMNILTPFIATLTEIVEALTAFVKTGDVSEFTDSFKASFDNLSSIVDLFNKGKDMGADLIAGLREGFSTGSIWDTITGWVDSFLNFFKGLLGIRSPSTVFEGYGKNIVEGLINGIVSFGKFIGNAIKTLVGWIMTPFQSIDKFDLANIFSVVFGGAVLIQIYKFQKALTSTMSNFKGFADEFRGATTGFMEGIEKSFAKAALAKLILNMAIALGILAVSLWIISKIPVEDLGKAGVAIVAMMGMLVIAMKSLVGAKGVISVGSVQMVSLGIAMAGLATAVLLLSAAVAAFGAIPLENLKKGGIAVAIALLVMSAAAFALGKASPWMIAASVGLAILSVSLLVMASALVAFAGVIKLYSKMDWDTITDGLLKMGVVLLGLAVAMAPMAVLAPGILIASVALGVLSVTLGMMLGTIAMFNTMSLESIGSGVGKIALALVGIGLAALVAAPGVLALGVASALLGVGMLAIGVGLSLAGAGLAVIATAGIAAGAALTAALQAFIAVLPIIGVQLVAAIASWLDAIADKAPDIVDSIVRIGTELLRGIRELAPELVKTGVELLMSLVDGIVSIRVRLFNAAADLILGFLGVVEERLPEFIEKGRNIIIGFITGIGESAEQLVVAAGETIVSFLTALDESINTYAPQIGQLGFSIATGMMTGLVRGFIPAPMLDAIRAFVDLFVNLFKSLLGINSPSTLFKGFGRDLVMGLINGIRSLVSNAGSMVGRLVSTVVKAISKLPGLIRSSLSSLLGILRSTFSNAFNAAVTAVRSGVDRIRSGISELPGIIRGAIGKVGEAAGKLGGAILNGIKSGLGKAIDAVGGFSTMVLNGLKSGLNSALNLPFNIPKLSIKIGPKKFSVGGQQLIPRFATGVTGFTGGAALVGELGPELVTMGRGSNVITNELLMKFVKTVSSFIKKTTLNNSKNSPGGSLQYVVSADFRGDPKKDGIAFASEIANGLIIGTEAQKNSVNSAMAGLASGASESFADILEIRSPSEVFKNHAKEVGKGFINGLVASVEKVRIAAGKLGEAATEAVEKTIRDGNLKLEAVQAKADAYASAAALVRKKAEDANSEAKKKRLRKEAKELEKLGKAEQKRANKDANRIKSADAAEAKRKKYDDADAAGRAEMDKEDAISASNRASELREKAIRLKQEAKLVRKYDKDRAKKLEKQATDARKAAQKAAQTADAKAQSFKKNEAQAKIDAANAKAEADQEEIDALNRQLYTVSAEDVAKAQAAFNTYSQTMLDAQAAIRGETPASEIKFEQNNYSPEAISAADAYRNGKSLLSIMERRLTPTK